MVVHLHATMHRKEGGSHACGQERIQFYTVEVRWEEHFLAFEAPMSGQIINPVSGEVVIADACVIEREWPLDRAATRK